MHVDLISDDRAIVLAAESFAETQCVESNTPCTNGASTWPPAHAQLFAEREQVITSLGKTLASEHGRLERLRSEIEAAKTEHDVAIEATQLRASREAEDAHREVVALRVERAALAKERADTAALRARKHLDREADRGRQLHRRLDDLGMTCSGEAALRGTLQDEVLELSREVEECRVAREEDRQRSHADLSQLLGELHDQRQCIEGDWSEVGQEIAWAHDEIDALRTQLESARQEAEQCQGIRDRVQRQFCAELSILGDELSSEHRSVKHSRSEAQLEIACVHAEATSVRDELGLEQHMVQQLQEDMAFARNEAARTSGELRAARKELILEQQRIHQLQKDADKQIQRTTSELRDVRAELQRESLERCRIESERELRVRSLKQIDENDLKELHRDVAEERAVAARLQAECCTLDELHQQSKRNFLLEQSLSKRRLEELGLARSQRAQLERRVLEAEMVALPRRGERGR